MGGDVAYATCFPLGFKLTMNPAFISPILFGALPLAAISVHCKIDPFWERRHLVALRCCPSLIAVSSAAVVISDKVQCRTSPFTLYLE